MEHRATTPGYERFVGRDISKIDRCPGYPSQMTRGPITSIQMDENTFTLNVAWMAARTTDSDWVMFQSPRRKGGEVTFYSSPRQYFVEHDYEGKDGNYEIDATYSGPAIILASGDNLDVNLVKRPPVQRKR